MRRRRAKLGLYGLTVAEIIPYCRGIVQSMTDNVNYPTPNPGLPVLAAAVDELETANIAASDGGTTLLAAVRTKRQKVFNLMRPLRDYVNEAGDGDEEILLSSGFDLAKLPTPLGPLPIPGNVQVRTLPGFGKVRVWCEKVKGATGYQVRFRPKDPQPVTQPDGSIIYEMAEWVNQDPSGPMRKEVTGLLSAVYYQFQMRAIGSGNPSPWSGSTDGLPS